MEEPARRVVRRIALALLDDAHRTARRYRKRHGAKPARLHDFRVAVRRFRSWTQLWPGTLEHKDERRVHAIARATTAARELDVHSAWLAQQDERRALAPLVKHLEKGRADADAEARDAAKALLAHYDRLRHHLEASEGPDVALGMALAVVIIGASEALEKSLHAIRSSRSHEAIHRARIAAKRLRYLLEPVPHTRQVVRELSALQDCAGALHDAHVFASEHELPAFLLERLRERTTLEYARLERRWLQPAPRIGGPPTLP